MIEGEGGNATSTAGSGVETLRHRLHYCTIVAPLILAVLQIAHHLIRHHASRGQSNCCAGHLDMPVPCMHTPLLQRTTPRKMPSDHSLTCFFGQFSHCLLYILCFPSSCDFLTLGSYYLYQVPFKDGHYRLRLRSQTLPFHTRLAQQKREVRQGTILLTPAPHLHPLIGSHSETAALP